MKTKLVLLICLTSLIFHACASVHYSRAPQTKQSCVLSYGASRDACKSPSFIPQVAVEQKKENGLNLQKMISQASADHATNNPSASYFKTPKQVKPAVFPLRTPPEILRIWVAPWEDEEGTLHGGSYIYVVVDKGEWVLRNRIIETNKIIPLED